MAIKQCYYFVVLSLKGKGGVVEILLGTNAALFLLLFAIWSRNNAADVLMKILLLAFGIANGLWFLRLAGYIIRV